MSRFYAYKEEIKYDPSKNSYPFGRTTFLCIGSIMLNCVVKIGKKIM